MLLDRYLCNYRSKALQTIEVEKKKIEEKGNSNRDKKLKKLIFYHSECMCKKYGAIQFYTYSNYNRPIGPICNFKI